MSASTCSRKFRRAAISSPSSSRASWRIVSASTAHGPPHLQQRALTPSTALRPGTAPGRTGGDARLRRSLEGPSLTVPRSTGKDASPRRAAESCGAADTGGSALSIRLLFGEHALPSSGGILSGVVRPESRVLKLHSVTVSMLPSPEEGAWPCIPWGLSPRTAVLAEILPTSPRPQPPPGNQPPRSVTDASGDFTTLFLSYRYSRDQRVFTTEIRLRLSGFHRWKPRRSHGAAVGRHDAMERRLLSEGATEHHLTDPQVACCSKDF